MHEDDETKKSTDHVWLQQQQAHETVATKNALMQVHPRVPNAPGWWWRSHHDSSVAVRVFTDEATGLLAYEEDSAVLADDESWEGPCLRAASLDAVPLREAAWRSWACLLRARGGAPTTNPNLSDEELRAAVDDVIFGTVIEPLRARESQLKVDVERERGYAADCRASEVRYREQVEALEAAVDRLSTGVEALAKAWGSHYSDELLALLPPKRTDDGCECWHKWANRRCGAEVSYIVTRSDGAVQLVCGNCTSSGDRSRWPIAGSDPSDICGARDGEHVCQLESDHYGDHVEPTDDLSSVYTWASSAPKHPSDPPIGADPTTSVGLDDIDEDVEDDDPDACRVPGSGYIPAGFEVLDESKNAAELALDAIAELCGCEEWDYPGQVVRDVQTALATMRRQLSEAEGERDARGEILTQIQRAAGATWWHGVLDSLLELRAQIGELATGWARDARYWIEACRRLEQQLATITDDRDTWKKACEARHEEAEALAAGLRRRCDDLTTTRQRIRKLRIAIRTLRTAGDAALASTLDPAKAAALRAAIESSASHVSDPNDAGTKEES
jgi:hypothetical protein